MKTPNLKAEELIEKYNNALTSEYSHFESPRMALICCDEIIATINVGAIKCNNVEQTVEYWEEVKKFVK